MKNSDAFTTLWAKLEILEEIQDRAVTSTFNTLMLNSAVPRQETVAAPKEEKLPEPALPSLGPAHLAVTDLPALSDSADGVIGPLVPRGSLGVGGMGRVDLALQTALRREVAIKSLRPEKRFDEDAQHSLIREGLVTGFLEHPNIIPVHGLGRDEQGLPRMVMKRIEGTSLSDLIHEPEHPSWAELGGYSISTMIELLIPVCHALHFAHTHGIIHRDIKPENIMIGQFGEVYLLDWGLGLRLGEPVPEGLVGTPAYLAPEMLDHQAELGCATDIFLFGATLHEVLTGTYRHGGGNLRAVLFSAYECLQIDYGPEIPVELAALCNACTSRDPKDRLQTALEVRQSLEAYLEHQGSARLTEEAQERVVVLERHLAQDELDEPTISKVFAETRFALQHALQIWPENVSARNTLESISHRMIDFALKQRNLGLAESLLTEVEKPSASIIEQVRALRSVVEQTQRDAARLHILEHDLDVRVSGKERARLMATVGVLLLLGVEAGMYLSRRGYIPELGLMTSLAVATGVLLVLLVTITLGRKTLLKTHVNRQLAIALVGVQSMVVAQHVVAPIIGMNVHAAHVGACLILFLGLVLMGGVINRRLLVAAPTSAICLVLAVAFPRYVMDAQAFGVATAFLAFAWIWNKPEHDRKRDQVE